MTSVVCFINNAIQVFVYNHRCHALDQFEINLWLNAEVLQKSIYQFYECLNVRFTHKTYSKNSAATVVISLMLKTGQRSYPWIVNRWKFLFQKKQLTDYYILILVCFPFGEFVDEVVNSHENYQGCR